MGSIYHLNVPSHPPHDTIRVHSFCTRCRRCRVLFMCQTLHLSQITVYSPVLRRAVQKLKIELFLVLILY